jgi:GAF domain-containing protein
MRHKIVDLQPADKLQAILRVSSVLSKTPDIKQLWPQIADELFTLFRSADRCFVIEYDESDGSLHAVVTRTRRPTETGDRFSRVLVKQCLNSLESFLSEIASSDRAVGLAQSTDEPRIRSVMCVPLATRNNRPFGIIQLETDLNKKFTQDDLKLLICVASQASVAIEKARMH